jgi:hypothetical protein
MQIPQREPGIANNTGVAQIRPSGYDKALLSLVGVATDTWEGK